LQEELSVLFTHQAASDAVKRAAVEYAARRTHFCNALANHGVGVTPDSGFNVWIPTEDETFVSQYLLENGWRVIHGAIFRLRSGPGIRITVSALSAARSEALAACVASALQRASGLRIAG
jgi:DNA-binding transcriptional MocR family regulator